MASGRTRSKIPPPPSIDQFPTWRRAFERKLRERPLTDRAHAVDQDAARDDSLEKSFSRLIEAGCDKDDLERALWWVVLNVHFSQSTVTTEIRDFLALAETLLPQLEELRPNLELL